MNAITETLTLLTVALNVALGSPANTPADYVSVTPTAIYVERCYDQECVGFTYGAEGAGAYVSGTDTESGEDFSAGHFNPDNKDVKRAMKRLGMVAYEDGTAVCSVKCEALFNVAVTKATAALK